MSSGPVVGTELIPWRIAVEHRWGVPLAMLRIESRRRAGFDLSTADADRLDVFKARLHEDDFVVHYEPRTAKGWWLVPPRPGVDYDLIRVPEASASGRPILSMPAWIGASGSAGVEVRRGPFGGHRLYLASGAEVSVAEVRLAVVKLERAWAVSWESGPFFDEDGCPYYDAERV